MMRTILPRACVVLCVLSGTMLNIRASDKLASSRPKPGEPTFVHGRSFPSTGLNTNTKDHFVLEMKLEGVPPVLNMNTLTDMVRNTPEKLFSSKAIQDRLISNKHKLIIRGMMGGKWRGELTKACRIRICAENVEQGKEMALGVIAVFNFWWQNDGREYLEIKAKDLEQSLAKLETSFAKAKQQREKAISLLKGELGFSAQTTAELKAKLLLLDVEIVGTRARIASIRKLAEANNKENVTPSAQEQIEIIKIKAHIDLAGLLAQQERLSSILEANRRVSHNNEVNRLGRQIRQSTSHLQALKSALDFDPNELQPLRVADNIVIHPIDWKGRKSSTRR